MSSQVSLPFCIKPYTCSNRNHPQHLILCTKDCLRKTCVKSWILNGSIKLIASQGKWFSGQGEGLKHMRSMLNESVSTRLECLMRLLYSPNVTLATSALDSQVPATWIDQSALSPLPPTRLIGWRARDVGVTSPARSVNHLTGARSSRYEVYKLGRCWKFRLDIVCT